jgi:hypothetical protein
MAFRKTIFLTMAALTGATILAAGLTVLPSSVQDAQASVLPIPTPRPGSGSNPCNIDTLDIDAEEVGNNCDFYGNTEIDASSEGSDLPCDPRNPLCEIIRPGPITEFPSDEDD